MKILATTILVFVSCMGLRAQQTDSLLLSRPVLPWFVERFKLSAGFFVPINNTNIQVGINGTAHGTDIDFEKDLGFAKSIGTFMANAQWRISRRSRASFSYYKINRSSSHTLDRDIIFKEDTFHANAVTNSFFRNSIFQVSYGYAILSKPKYEAGLMIGAHIVGSKAGLALNSAAGGLSKESDFGFTAPLPDLGIWGGYAFSKRFAINLEVDYLSLTVGDVTGSIFAYNLAFTYKVAPKFDLTLGFTGLNCKIDVEKDNANGRFRWGYNGPSFSIIFSFGDKSWRH